MGESLAEPLHYAHRCLVTIGQFEPTRSEEVERSYELQRLVLLCWAMAPEEHVARQIARLALHELEDVPVNRRSVLCHEYADGHREEQQRGRDAYDEPEHGFLF